MRAKYLTNGPKKQLTEISEVLGTVIEGAAAGVDVRQAEMIDTWSSFAPGDWRDGEPIGVRDGVLLVAVPDGTIGSLLRYQTEAFSRRFKGVRRRPGAVDSTADRVPLNHLFVPVDKEFSALKQLYLQRCQQPHYQPQRCRFIGERKEPRE